MVSSILLVLCYIVLCYIVLKLALHWAADACGRSSMRLLHARSRGSCGYTQRAEHRSRSRSRSCSCSCSRCHLRPCHADNARGIVLVAVSVVLRLLH
eukprot:COSAG06_NODE_35554_length_458_cov_2.044568_1_plen_96_part_10